MSRPRVVPVDEYPTPREVGRDSGDWYSTAPDSEGVPYYLDVLRSRLWFVVLVILLCVGAAAFSLSRATKVYESSADILVTPVASDNSTLVGLGLPSASGDPARDIETVARLIKTQAVARRVIKTRGLDTTPGALLANVDATPVASSNVIAIAARADSPAAAARLANAFATAAVADRTARMRAELDTMIPELRRQVQQTTDATARAALLQRLRDLEALRAGQDPTVRLEVPAELHASPISPKPMLTLVAAVIAGLFIGGAVVFGSQLIDPRLKREEQLRRYRIPVLARVPSQKNAGRRKTMPLLPSTLSHAGHDAYALLAATLAKDANKHAVLITGPTPGDGKTTTALNLATSIAASDRVVLVEGDSRRPKLAQSLRLAPNHGLADVLAGRAPLSDALLPGAPGAPGVQLLLQNPAGSRLPAFATNASADALIRDAELLADWLVIDAPPLTAVPDVLPFAQRVDDVIIVVQLGNTRLKQLAQLAELLVQQEIRPTGFLLIGGKNAAYYG